MSPHVTRNVGLVSHNVREGGRGEGERGRGEGGGGEGGREGGREGGGSGGGREGGRRIYLLHFSPQRKRLRSRTATGTGLATGGTSRSAEVLPSPHPPRASPHLLPPRLPLSQMNKGHTIYQFLQKCLENLRKEFPELRCLLARSVLWPRPLPVSLSLSHRVTSVDSLMYIKEDLIIPHVSFALPSLGTSIYV